MFRIRKVTLKDIEKRGRLIRYVKDQTHEMCIASIKNNWTALKYIKDQTPLLCKLAVDINPQAMKYVRGNEMRTLVYLMGLTLHKNEIKKETKMYLLYKYRSIGRSQVEMENITEEVSNSIISVYPKIPKFNPLKYRERIKFIKLIEELFYENVFNSYDVMEKIRKLFSEGGTSEISNYNKLSFLANVLNIILEEVNPLLYYEDNPSYKKKIASIIDRVTKNLINLSIRFNL